MKKSRILLLLAAATVMVSCQKEKYNDVLSSDTSVISAVIDGDNTKTTLDGVKVCWISGDAIAVNKTKYLATPDATDGRKATFALTSTNPLKPATAPTDAPFCAYYPFDANKSTTKGEFILPSTQNYSESNPLGYVNPMYAVSESLEGTFHFKNVCGLLTIDLKGIGAVSDITISANEYLAGKLTNVAISDQGELTYTAIEDDGYYASKSVSLGCGTVATLSKETARRFYIALPEGDFTGVKLTVTTDLGKVEFPATKTVSIKKNNIYHLPEMTVATDPITFTFKQSTLTFEKAAYEITPSINTVNYYTEILSKEDIATFGDVETYATSMLSYYLQNYGPETIISNLMHKGAYTLKATVQPETEYCLLAFAVDSQCNIVSTVATEEFKTPAMPSASAKYEDYLGEWIMGTDIIKIEQKVAGSTYYLSGIYPQIEYEIAPVEATYQNGYLFLKEQQSPTELILNVSGIGNVTCAVFLSGLEEGETFATYPFYTSTPVTIFRGEFDGNETIKVSPGATSYGDIESVAFSWVISEGEYSGEGNTFTGTKLVDMTAKKALPNALFGQWTCASATEYFSEVTYKNWVWTISESGAGVAIDNFDVALPNVQGLYGTLVNSVIAQYDGDDKAGTLTIQGGAMTGLNDGTYYVSWWGDDEDSNYSITFDVDLEEGTISLKNGYFDCEASDFITAYFSPIVFTKGASVSAKANVAGERKAAKHTAINSVPEKKIAVGSSKNSTLILQDVSMNFTTKKHPFKDFRF